MAATIAGTFTDRAAAETALQRLRAAGVAESDISLIVRGEEHPPVAAAPAAGVNPGATLPPTVNPTRPGAEPVVETVLVDDEDEPVATRSDSAAAAGTAAGGLIGGIGGLLAGLAALAVPGIGPILAAGPLAASLGGAAIGAAAGGLVGALVDSGMPEEVATTYASGVERGDVLLSVRTEGDLTSQERIRQILVDAGAVNLFPSVTQQA